ncbi:MULTISPECIES: LysR substrate-binding domain-containing protein [Culturomica]|uniref:LysR substrate-binding domain-containing protein n=1 Tax=Culturomica TaxID=1926651 RepID=UPI00033BC769|nr:MULTISPECIES: LysR substrate-binding domain-containing protein [Culturomica]CCZ10560.1 putative uncharacterized protein [Odoribacter sp. CAG:788]HBO27967.1 hypothetical protein [Culturomica sp.]
MLDHKLIIFNHLAKNPNMTKVAETLHLSQPAVSKSIKELENELSITLFDRIKGRMQLTTAGKYLLQATEDLIRKERDIRSDIDRLKNTFSGTLCLGASTTLSQYILPEILSGFTARYPNIHIQVISGNTAQIEQEICNDNLHLAFIEGTPNQPDIHYIPFLKDEIVLTGAASAKIPATLQKTELPQLKFVFREKDSGTLSVIRKALSEIGIPLSSLHEQLILGTTEGIKNYLQLTDCFAFLSVYSIRHELMAGKLKIIDIEDVTIERMFHIIHKQGYLDAYARKFMDYAIRYSQKHDK